MVIPIGLLYHIIHSSPQTLIALTEQILKYIIINPDPSNSTKIDTAANDNTINLIIVFLLSSGFFFFRIKYTGSIKIFRGEPVDSIHKYNKLTPLFSDKTYMNKLLAECMVQ